jgi:diguanylate cyclase (GGDEF)-like protein
MIEIAKNGRGYTTYAFPKPGTTAPIPKITYVIGYQPWQWAVMTGTFYQDIDAMQWELTQKTAIWLCAVGAVLLLAVYFVTRSIIKPLGRLSGSLKRLAGGDIDAEVAGSERSDEFGMIARTVVDVREAVRRQARERQAQEEEAKSRAAAERHSTMQKIAAQNRMFDVALNNMSHGLCMFDAEGRLIVRNNRYLEIFRVPPGSAEPGCTLRELLEVHRAGGVTNGDHDGYIADLRAAIARGKSFRSDMELNDGRIVHISSEPMLDGGWVATHEDVTERLRHEEHVTHMARHDALTGLSNRLHFRERTEEALPLLRRGESVAILCIDLDHFKEVNDTLGHPSGDKLLTLVADRLRENVRETDILARLGGDEFAVVQTAWQMLEEVTVLAGRIVEVLSEPYEVDGHEVVVGASIGIAVAPGDGHDPDQLLKHADMALYRAKSDGRGTFRFFEAEMDARLQARRKLERELRKALAQGEFQIYYQPIINLKDNRVTAFEALLRWNHPERGLVMPDDFVPVAEDIGLIGPIGEWVLRQACAEAAAWPRGIRVAVNVSPSQFRKPLVPTVVQALAAAGLHASRLDLEITESVLLQNNEATMTMLRQLHDIGVRISMDDFGTGYSSLSYLQSFPFDKIKIDRSFVTDREASSDSAAIVRAIAGLGSNLGMKTTAEGVETREQLDWLRSEGCTELQGHYFSRPRPAKDLADLISDVEGQLAA